MIQPQAVLVRLEILYFKSRVLGITRFSFVFFPNRTTATAGPPHVTKALVPRRIRLYLQASLTVTLPPSHLCMNAMARV
jgi:hypothetical protein